MTTSVDQYLPVCCFVQTIREPLVSCHTRTFQMMSASLFSHVPAAPPIEVLDMKRKHDEDISDVKINLTVGGYKVASDVLWTSV